MDQNAQVQALLKKLGIGTGYAIPEDDDLSGQGAEFEVLNMETVQKLSEENPLVGQGYIPIGECLQGTGNCYYAKLNSVQHGIYRVNDGSDVLVPVLANISTISRYRGK